MKVYTQAGNEESSVYIEYPIFYNFDKSNELNAMILKSVQEFATLDPDYFLEDPKYSLNYQTKVTLLNSNILSIVSWGTTDIEVSAFPTYNLYTLNIDLHSLKKIKLTDLYKIDDNFKKAFFEKTFWPSLPGICSGEDYFSGMLEYLSDRDEHSVAGPFTDPDTVSFFLMPDGIVLSFPIVHAYGDHFEAELLYSDIQNFYISENDIIYYIEQ